MKLVAGVDSSTQSCKVEIRDQESGKLISIGTAPHEPTFPPKSEQDPDLWWTAFLTAFEKATLTEKVNKSSWKYSRIERITKRNARFSFLTTVSQTHSGYLVVGQCTCITGLNLGTPGWVC